MRSPAPSNYTFTFKEIVLKVRFIINPASGSAGSFRRVGELVFEVMGDSNGIFEVKASRSADDAGELAREAADKGYEFVFACGGDGTINNVASRLVNTKTALGILPAGSGNALARELNIPSDPLAAISLLKTGRVRSIDAGKASGRYFFTTAGFAFEGALSRRYNEGGLASRVRGLAPYYMLALIEYAKFKPDDIELVVDGQTINAAPLILTAANTSQWGGGAFISPGASVEDGLLDFCVVPKAGIAAAIALWRSVMKGSVEKLRGYERVRGKEAVIRGRKAAFAHVDGEPFECGGELQVSVMQGALRVLAP